MSFVQRWGQYMWLPDPPTTDASGDFEQRAQAVGLRPDMVAHLASEALDLEPGQAVDAYRRLVHNAERFPNDANADNHHPFKSRS